MDPREEKALRDIDTYGCHVIHVLEDEGHPQFTYSLGIQLKTGEPELIVAGMKQPVAHFMVNEYNRRVKAGDSFSAGQRASGFLDGFDVEFRLVHPSHFRAHFGWAFWLYKGDDFRVLQAVFPTTTGVWPWEDGASEWFRYVQPILDAPAD